MELGHSGHNLEKCVRISYSSIRSLLPGSHGLSMMAFCVCLVASWPWTATMIQTDLSYFKSWLSNTESSDRKVTKATSATLPLSSGRSGGVRLLRDLRTLPWSSVPGLLSSDPHPSSS